MWGKDAGWDKIHKNDPLGLQRDITRRHINGNSLSDIDIFSKRSFREEMELRSIVNKDGSIDQVGMLFTSYGKKKSTESDTTYLGDRYSSSSLSDEEYDHRDYSTTSWLYDGLIDEYEDDFEPTPTARRQYYSPAKMEQVDKYNIFGFSKLGRNLLEFIDIDEYDIGQSTVEEHE